MSFYLFIFNEKDVCHIHLSKFYFYLQYLVTHHTDNTVKMTSDVFTFFIYLLFGKVCFNTK